MLEIYSLNDYRKALLSMLSRSVHPAVIALYLSEPLEQIEIEIAYAKRALSLHTVAELAAYSREKKLSHAKAPTQIQHQVVLMTLAGFASDRISDLVDCSLLDLPELLTAGLTNEGFTALPDVDSFVRGSAERHALIDHLQAVCALDLRVQSATGMACSTFGHYIAPLQIDR